MFFSFFSDEQMQKNITDSHLNHKNKRNFVELTFIT